MGSVKWCYAAKLKFMNEIVIFIFLKAVNVTAFFYLWEFLVYQCERFVTFS